MELVTYRVSSSVMTCSREYSLLTSCLLLLGILASVVDAQDCVNTMWGDDHTVVRARTDTMATHEAFLAVGAGTYLVTCDGVIDRWDYYSHAITPANERCHDVTFQVWRPTDVTVYDYQLVGENILSQMAPADVSGTAACALGGGARSVNVQPALQIPVQPGDVIGWNEPGRSGNNERRFGYDEGLSGSNAFAQVHILHQGHACAMTVGQTCSWQIPTADQTVRRYSFEAQMNQVPVPILASPDPAGPTTIRIDEAQPIGTYVFTVHAHNNHNWNPVVTRPLVYTIVTVQPPPGTTGVNNPFVIDPDTGVITTGNVLNYDGPEWDPAPPAPGPGVAQVYTITVEVSDGTQTSQPAELTVQLYDVNEPHTINALANPYTVDASTTGNNVLIGTVTCVDPDVHNGNFRNYDFWLYDVDPNNELFTVNANGQVRTARDLRDWRGQEEVYTLSIVASDGVFSDGPENMYISVTNIRQPPRITNLPNSVTVREDDVPAANIFTVTSWHDNGAPVTYIELAEYPQTWTSLFDVDPNSGVVSHIANPGFDYMAIREYQVEITVHDNYMYYADEAANLTVEVEWVNQAPVFVTSPYASTIPEGEPVDTMLPDVLLEVTDRDLPLGDWVDYTLSGPGSHLFHADNTTNRVYTAADIRLPNNVDSITYNLIVAAFDAEGEFDTAPLDVTVTDINDHAPVFNPDSYTGTVPEFSPGEIYVLTVAATDLDGPNSDIALFFITDAVADLYFQINVAGDLSTKQPIDYSVHPNFTFTVMAIDSGQPPLNGTATVFIQVIEANTHTPTFVPSFYNLEVKSDTDAGEVVLTITAQDNDTERVNTVTYFFLIPEDDYNIGQTSGEISVDHGLGSGNKYLIYPMARDKGVPEYFSDPATVRIDTYKPSSHLVDIHMSMSAEEFSMKEEEFKQTMTDYLQPWLARIESYQVDGAGTVVTMYALEDDTAETVDDLRHEKHFVHRDSLLSKLRTNIQGNPRDELKGGEFLEYGIYEVQPTHPVWIVDTVEGIVTLSLLCLLVVIIIILLLIYLCKRKGWLCFKKKQVEPTPWKPPPTDDGAFELKYKTPKDGKGTTHVLIPAITRSPDMLDYDKNKELTPVLIPNT